MFNPYIMNPEDFQKDPEDGRVIFTIMLIIFIISLIIAIV